MKYLIGAVALTIASPAFAQTAPAEHQGHGNHGQHQPAQPAQHQGHGQHQGGQHQGGQHGQGHGQHGEGHGCPCCQDRNGNGRMDCCEARQAEAQPES